MAEVLDYAQSCNLIRLSKPGRDRDDKSKYCAYHRNRGHDTDDCSSLKRVIDELLKSGELSQFVQKEKSRRSWRKCSESPRRKRRTRTAIVMIEVSHRPRKARNRPFASYLEVLRQAMRQKSDDSGPESYMWASSMRGLERSGQKLTP